MAIIISYAFLFAVTLFMSPIALADLGAANSGDNSSLRLG